MSINNSQYLQPSNNLRNRENILTITHETFNSHQPSLRVGRTPHPCVMRDVCRDNTPFFINIVTFVTINTTNTDCFFLVSAEGFQRNECFTRILKMISFISFIRSSVEYNKNSNDLKYRVNFISSLGL